MPKVLIIDDEPGIRDMVSFALESEGYAVHVAGNGKEGIEKVAKQKIDLVITDLKMPVMDGVTIMSFAIRSTRECSGCCWRPDWQSVTGSGF